MAPVQGARLGLRLGLAAFLAHILAPLVPPLLLLHMLLGVGAGAVLLGDARRRGRPEVRRGAAAMLLLAAGFLVVLAAFALARGAQAAEDLGAWTAWLWAGAAGEVAVAAGFALAPLGLAARRSRPLLLVAFGAALSTAVLATLAAQGLGQAALAAGAGLGADPGAIAADPALADEARGLEGALLAKGVPSILFAWAYATILGRMRSEARPKDPWST